MKFFISRGTDTIVEVVQGDDKNFSEESMAEIVPNTSEGAGEKHLPVITVSGDMVTVEVGSVEHPMTEEHYIQWIYLETKCGGQIKYLKPDDDPRAEFTLIDDEVISAYEYCNIHGLWQSVL
ncbi:desulfoferrodoxin family protein [Mobilisporobacter senegalensis]|uniref:desulfoferrodoxin family protein n=1 Tax=Mobilisporobacter senegalensis TaxID=1329262 RepID=UPI0038CC11B8